MSPARGDIVRRGDTGGYGLVISKSMLHTVSGLVILCAVIRSETMAASFPHAVTVDADEQHLHAIPVSVHTAPASALAEIVGAADEDQLRAIARVLHAATSP